MGLGLASTRYIPKGEVIAYFVGDLLVKNGKIYNMRVAAGNTRYMLWMGKKFVVDTFKHLKKCKASRCNSFKNAAVLHQGSWVKAVQNCELVCDLNNKIVRIKSIKNIPRFTELFLDYGKSFHFVEE